MSVFDIRKGDVVIWPDRFYYAEVGVGGKNPRTIGGSKIDLDFVIAVYRPVERPKWIWGFGHGDSLVQVKRIVERAGKGTWLEEA